MEIVGVTEVVVIGHVVFFATNIGTPSQAIRVKITAIEGLVMFVILRPISISAHLGPVL